MDAELKVKKKEVSSMKVVDVFSLLLQSITETHIFHLQTKSYAQHVALSGYYEGVGTLVDSLIETYQGQYGIITGYKTLPLKG